MEWFDEDFELSEDIDLNTMFEIEDAEKEAQLEDILNYGKRRNPDYGRTRKEKPNDTEGFKD